jgi:hypothetical protein
VKRSPKYSESVREDEEQSHEIVQREESLRRQYAQQIEGLQQIIQTQLVHLDEKDRAMEEKDRTIAAGQLEVQQLRQQLREKICQLKDERKGKDSEILKLTERISGLELQLGMGQAQQSVASGGAEGKTRIKLKWKKGRNAPREISNVLLGEMAATVDENCMYIREGSNVYIYDIRTFVWYQLPDGECDVCALAIVSGLLTQIGGIGSMGITNQLFSLIWKGESAKWKEEFPPMPTKRYGACVLRTNKALIVAGGQGDCAKVATTEVLNTATLQWSTAVDLPQPMFCGSLLQVDDDRIYMVGMYDKGSSPIKSVYTCSLNTILQSCNQQSFGMRPARSLLPSQVWKSVTDNIPAIDSSYVSLHDRLLAIGGKHPGSKPITAVHMYDPSTNSWEVVSHMATPRLNCYAAVLPDNQLIVVGGYTGGYTGSGNTDSVEIATSHFE